MCSLGSPLYLPDKYIYIAVSEFRSYNIFQRVPTCAESAGDVSVSSLPLRLLSQLVLSPNTKQNLQLKPPHEVSNILIAIPIFTVLHFFFDFDA
jgi:hypothetical protein